MFSLLQPYYDVCTTFVYPDFHTKARFFNCGGRAGLKDSIPTTELGITEALVCTRVDRGVCIATEPTEDSGMPIQTANGS